MVRRSIHDRPTDDGPAAQECGERVVVGMGTSSQGCQEYTEVVDCHLGVRVGGLQLEESEENFESLTDMNSETRQPVLGPVLQSHVIVVE